MSVWTKMYLRDACEFNPERLTRAAPEEIRYIDISSVGVGRLETIPSRIARSVAPSRAQRIIRDGDTVLSTVRPNRRSMFFTTLELDGCVASTGFAVIRARTSILDRRFLYYATFDQKYTEHLVNNEKGAAYPAVDIEALGSYALSVPPIEEQKEIGAILAALDDKIELNRRMAATLEEMARALYRSWFVDFDPVKAKAEGLAPAFMDEATADLFPDRFGDDGLPEGWTSTTIGEVAEIVGGATPSTKAPEYWDGGVHAWATPRDLAGLSDTFLLETSRQITDQGLAKIGSGLSPAGSMLLSSRAPIGYRAISRIPVAVNQGFIVIRETATITGIEAYLWCEVNMDTILSNANGSTFQEISKKNFRPIPYVLADESVRRSFQKMAKPMFERLATLSEENRTLADLRDSLLPKLMSGELRVGDAQDQIEEVA